MRALRDLAHLLHHDLGVLVRIERDERSHALTDVARRDDGNLGLRELRGRLRREDHVLVVRQHDDVSRVRLSDAREDLLGRGVHRRATPHRHGPQRFGDVRESVARDDRQHADRRRAPRAPRRRLDHDPCRPLVLGGHCVEILDHHIRDTARREADAKDLVRLKRVDMHLHHGLITDDEDAVGAEALHLLAYVDDGTRGILDEELHVVRALP